MTERRPILRVPGADALPAELRGGVVAIGNFDGLHRGHQAVLERARAEAARLVAPAIVLTFDPHPRSLFRPDIPLFVLSPPPMRALLLGALGFHAVVEQPFTHAFAAQSAEAFVAEVLVGALGISHAVTGFDFHFGKDRCGGPAFLMEAGAQNGFGVTLVDAFRDEGSEVVSSSRIRALLAEARPEEAAGLLGYRYTVAAPVISGKQLGRTIGFPTANMALPEDNALAHGIYAVRLRSADGTLHDGVASFGRRPTIEADGVPLLETFVFDASPNLYHQQCRVSFFGFLRGEAKFEGLDALMQAMRRDEAEARALLAGVRPLSELDRVVAF